MPIHQLEKCKNCGAELEPVSDTNFRCKYCGSLYSASKTEAPAQLTSTERAQVTDNPPVNLPDRADKKAKDGCAVAFLFAFIILIIAAETNKRNGWANGLLAPREPVSETSASDSTSRQEITQNTQTADNFETARVVLTEDAKETLRKLAAVNIDVGTFRRLYRKARKQKSNNGVTNFIMDRSSPQGWLVEGVYPYISADFTGITLMLNIQHGADKWLFTNSVTFNADGKQFDYQPKFTQQRAKGKAWEETNENIDNYLPMLITIAQAKTATITLHGNKSNYTATLSQAQKEAFGKLLQIYKGLLLGYDKD